MVTELPQGGRACLMTRRFARQRSHSRLSAKIPLERHASWNVWATVPSGRVRRALKETGPGTWHVAGEQADAESLAVARVSSVNTPHLGLRSSSLPMLSLLCRLVPREVRGEVLRWTVNTLLAIPTASKDNPSGKPQ